MLDVLEEHPPVADDPLDAYSRAIAAVVDRLGRAATLARGRRAERRVVVPAER